MEREETRIPVGTALVVSNVDTANKICDEVFKEINLSKTRKTKRGEIYELKKQTAIEICGKTAKLKGLFNEMLELYLNLVVEYQVPGDGVRELILYSKKLKLIILIESILSVAAVVTTYLRFK